MLKYVIFLVLLTSSAHVHALFVGGKKIKTVVIDPGHGGKDPGCHGNFAHEKDICLAVSLRLGKLIEEFYPDVKVVFTRKTDVFVELHNRARIANEHKADLFICIHVNAGGNGNAYGAETYVMGLHKSETNLAVAKRENAAVLMEDDYKVQYEGFDPNSDEGNIIFSLYQNKYLEHSISFASHVQRYFKQYAGRHDRGVKQAGFLVLVRTTMPAVLIETGFATNAQEEKFLADPIGQDIMAAAIFQAFIDYKKEVENDIYVAHVKTYTPIPKSAFQLANTNEQNKTTQTEIKENTESKDSSKTQPNTHPDIRFKVQFMSLPRKLSSDDNNLKDIPNLEIIEHNGIYRYNAGNEASHESAQIIRERLVGKGYKDAYVVAYKGKERISVKEALEYINKKN
ncbi:MAG: N-acetylmuramoyl-L-alanine amidase [Candidatus Competibacteraceae bacterium]|nr:N-acetylmuramoyl-L-alanine amidase [Candidatus Competibacteraceae bacterium]